MSSAVKINKPVLVLVGPTAVGKTALCAALFKRFDCELVSMDSMQVYRMMDIGTAKPSQQERELAPHHLIDICNPDEQYDAAQFVADCLQAIKNIHARGRVPLISGGTGLYLNALLNGLFKDISVSDGIKQEVRARLAAEGRAALHAELARHDPEAADRVHPNDTQRILRGLEIYHGTGVSWSEHLRRQAEDQQPPCFNKILQVGLNCERQLLKQRIALRTQQMFEQGLVDEVIALRSKGYPAALPSMQAIGYRHINNYLDTQATLEETQQEIILDTGRYAKRQMTWFRRNRQLQWVERTNHHDVLQQVERFLSSSAEPAWQHN